MKLENPGYRLNQRRVKGTICGSFNWKIRLQLSQTFYDTGFPAFFSIVMVIIRESGALRIKDTISILEFRQGIDFCYYVNILLFQPNSKIPYVMLKQKPFISFQLYPSEKNEKPISG